MVRCIAKSKRSGKQCQNWAMRKKTTCRLHGGKSTGPKTKTGKEKISRVHYKHGYRSKVYQNEHSKMVQLIKDSKNYLQTI